MTFDLSENLGPIDLRERLGRLLATDPAVGAVVLQELQLEIARSSLAAHLKETEAKLRDADDKLKALRDNMPRLEAAGIAISRGRTFVRDGVEDETLKSSAPAVQPVAPARRTRSQDRGQFAIDLQDLVHYGMLAAGQQLVAIYKGQRHVATLQADLSLNVAGHGPAPTLSWAGRMITPNNINGWRFWHVERGGELVELAQLREELSRRRSRS